MARISARRSLFEMPPRIPAEEGLALVGLDETGRSRFVSVLLEVSQGDPGSQSTPESADTDFQELVDLAGR